MKLRFSGAIGALGFIAAILMGSCSRCSISSRSTVFQGFVSTDRKEFQVRASGGSIAFHSTDAGDLSIDIPAGAFSTTEKVEILTTQTKALEEDFQTNPYTSQGIKRLPGEVRIRLEKQIPVKSILFCYNHDRIFSGNELAGKMLPLVHWFYDGENEILGYFSSPKRHTEPVDKKECLEIEKEDFSTLESDGGRPEAVILFAIQEKQNP